MPIGRTGPEDEDILRPKKNAESRESKFARKQREQKAAEIAAAASAPADEPIKVTRDRSERSERPARGVDAVKEIPRAATSRFNARVVEDVLAGKRRGAARAATTMNAGAAIYLAGLAPSLAAAIAHADRTIDDGAAHDALERLRAATARQARET